MPLNHFWIQADAVILIYPCCIQLDSSWISWNLFITCISENTAIYMILMHQKTISSEMEGINFGEFSAECPEITRDSLCLCNLLRDFPDKYVVCLTSKLPEFCSAGGELPPSNLCCSTLCSAVPCSIYTTAKVTGTNSGQRPLE